MQVTYFPYLRMDRQDEILVGALGLKIWNYKLKAEDYIPDQSFRNVLDQLMHANVRQLHTIEDMGVISFGDADFHEFSPEEKAICSELRLILFLGTIADSGVLERGPNVGHMMCTSENFTIVEQNFQPDAQFTAVQDGYIVRMLHGGYRVTEVKYQAPEFVPFPMQTRRDNELVVGLLKAKVKQKRLYRRIMRATEMLMQAYYNDSKITDASRILNIASAYEILFDLPESGQRVALRNEFERLFDIQGDPRRTFVAYKDRSGTSHWINKTIKVYWANEFYKLRNNIIHGSTLNNTDFIFKGVQRNFDIAILFFVLGVKKYLESAKCMPQSMDQIRWGTTDHPEFANDAPDPDDPIEFTGFIYDKGTTRRLVRDFMTRSRRRRS
jgi:hypothetical protein